MPELPEVETIASDLLAAGLVGVQIVEARVFWERTVAMPTVDQFCKKIAGQKICGISRRGKFLVFSLSKDTLLVHLRMTGKFSIISSDNLEKHSHERVQLWLADRRVLSYQDQRKFGKMYLLNNPEEILGNIGLEPLSDQFTLIAFLSMLKGHKSQIKPFLLNQKYIAGLGNIYVDEALWEAKIAPQRTIDTLSKKELKLLHHAIQAVLIRAIAHKGTSLGTHRGNYYSASGRQGQNQTRLNVFRLDNKPCPRCGHLIRKIIVAQRGTHYCPHCQEVGNQP